MPRTIGIDQHLHRVRRELDRLTPAQAHACMLDGTGRLVDTRPEFQRRAGGLIDGALVVERNHLEWRLDPTSEAHLPEAVDHDVRWVILCDEGFSSSLAAASLQRLGLRRACDVIGGFRAWCHYGLPVRRMDPGAASRRPLGTAAPAAVSGRSS